MRRRTPVATAALARMALAALTALAAACASSSPDGEVPTSIRVHAKLDPSAQITQLELEGSGRKATVPEAAAAVLGADETVTILLDDTLAGKPLHVDVWGLARSARVAHTAFDTVPELHRTVDVAATLATGASCRDECRPSATQCTEQGLAPCGQFDADSCLEWGPPVPCPSGQSCASGACTACAWTLATVDATTDVGPSSSLQVDSARGVHVSYWDRTGHALRYAHRPLGGTWSFNKVDDEAAGRHSSLALDGNGGVHIAYAVDGGLRVLRMADRPRAIATWTRSDIDTIETNGPYPSLAITPSGTAWVSYLRGNVSTAGERLYLRYGQRPSGSAAWDLRTLDEPNNIGSATSILTDAAGHVAIGYHEIPNHDLKFVELSNLAEKVTVDATDNVGQHASFALDGSGGVHASYYDNTASALKYARRSQTGTWETAVVDTSPNVGQFTSLAVDPSGDPHIAYYDLSRRALKYARRKGESWFTTTLDQNVHRDGGIALAADPTGGIHISYVGEKQPASELKYAYLCK
ncbi:hypothetical protein [Pendulispora albinea]|uniref:Uncharacterized protein n=1 Tax=Pendulispora albinea TaxID=2741071 RepID=A0ABZ2M803_9BACT